MSDLVINTSSKGNTATTPAADASMNKSLLRQNIMCNHCLFNCETYEKMKEHYKSDFHKYNLNRVTMNLAPISFEDYNEKKRKFLKMQEEMKQQKEQGKNEEVSANCLYCDICSKKFLSNKKLKEHLNSKMHQKNEAEHKLKEQAKKEETIQTSTPSQTKKEDKTTLDDVSICLFCNQKNEDLEKNMFHMINVHKLDVPFLFCINNYKGMINLFAKKIFTYHACLTCDTQKFATNKALQNHMIDKGHTSINNEDLDEFLFKYYDMKKLNKIKDPNFRKMKEFKILILRSKIAKKLKEKDDDGNEWEDIDEEEEDEAGEGKKKKIIEEDDEDFEPLVLPSGELLLEDGTTLGNKIYNIYYKQRIRLNKYENLQKERIEQLKMKNNSKMMRLARKRRNVNRNVHSQVVRGSNKANFEKANMLFVARKQVLV